MTPAPATDHPIELAHGHRFDRLLGFYDGPALTSLALSVIPADQRRDHHLGHGALHRPSGSDPALAYIEHLWRVFHAHRDEQILFIVHGNTFGDAIVQGLLPEFPNFKFEIAQDMDRWAKLFTAIHGKATWQSTAPWSWVMRHEVQRQPVIDWVTRT